MATVPFILFPLESWRVKVSSVPGAEESRVAGFIGSLKVADTIVPVSRLVLPFVLVGVFVAPLLGLVESTVTPYATLGKANPARTAASGSATSHECGINLLPNPFIFTLFHTAATNVALDLRG
jgi:hypothetical protein